MAALHHFMVALRSTLSVKIFIFSNNITLFNLLTNDEILQIIMVDHFPFCINQ